MPTAEPTLLFSVSGSLRYFAVLLDGREIGRVERMALGPVRSFPGAERGVKPGPGRWTHGRTENYFVTRDDAVKHLLAIHADDPWFEDTSDAEADVLVERWQVQFGAFGSCASFDTEIEALRWIAAHSQYRVQKIVDSREAIQGAIAKGIRKTRGADRSESAATGF